MLPFEGMLFNIWRAKCYLAVMLQILVANLDYSDYSAALPLRVCSTEPCDGRQWHCPAGRSMHKTKITKLFSFAGLKRVELPKPLWATSLQSLA